MADTNESRPNEFYLLSTDPVKAARCAKMVDVEVCSFARTGRVVDCAVKSGLARLAVQHLGQQTLNIQFDLKAKKAVGAPSPWAPCTKCGMAHPRVLALARHGRLTVSIEKCSCTSYRLVAAKAVVRKEGQIVAVLPRRASDLVILKADNRRIAYKMFSNMVAVFSWEDIVAGKYEGEVVDLKAQIHARVLLTWDMERAEREAHPKSLTPFFGGGFYWLVDFILDGKRLSVLWVDRYIKLALMDKPTRLDELGVSKWTALLKVDKNRYAVSGLNQSSNSYIQGCIQVIKLVDRWAKPLDKVQFKISDSAQEHAVRSLMLIGRRTILAVATCRYCHLLDVKGQHIRTVKANIDPFRNCHPLPHCWILGSRRAIVGARYGKLAIIKLTFH